MSKKVTEVNNFSISFNVNTIRITKGELEALVLGALDRINICVEDFDIKSQIINYGVDFGTHSDELYYQYTKKYHEFEVSGGFSPGTGIKDVQWEVDTQAKAIAIVNELLPLIYPEMGEYVTWYALDEDGLEVDCRLV